MPVMFKSFAVAGDGQRVFEPEGLDSRERRWPPQNPEPGPDEDVPMYPDTLPMSGTKRTSGLKATYSKLMSLSEANKELRDICQIYMNGLGLGDFHFFTSNMAIFKPGSET